MAFLTMGWLTLLFTLLFSIISPMFSVELDIYQKLIDDLDYEDPRVPRVSEKVRQQMKEILKQIDQEEAVIQGGKKETGKHSHVTDANIHPEESSFDNKKSESKGDIAKESIKHEFDSSQEMEVEMIRQGTEKVPEVHRNSNLDETFFRQFIIRLSDVLTRLQVDSNRLCVKVVLKRELCDYIPAIIVSTLAILGTLVLLVITKYLFFQEMYWKRNLVFVLFIGFLCSISWEWYRMYQLALSEKVTVSQQDIPPSYRPNEINVFQSISLFFQQKLTILDDDYVKYIESLLVMFSKNLGISFRLFFKEIPIHWQGFFFLAIILITIIIKFKVNKF